MQLTHEQMIEAMQEMGRSARVTEKALRKARARELAGEVANTYALVMGQAPCSRVFPEGWGTEEREDGLSVREVAALHLVSKVLARMRGVANSGLLCQAATFSDGASGWRHVVRGDTDRVAAGFGCPLPEALTLIGMGWKEFAEIALRRVMRELSAEIEATDWAWPVDLASEGEEE